MKQDSTLSFFESNPDVVEQLLRIVPSASSRSSVYGIGWSYRSERTSWESIASSLSTTSAKDAVYFLDTSFVDRQTELPDFFVDNLLRAKIIITPHIWEELQPWINAPYSNRRLRDEIVKARHADNTTIHFFDATQHWNQDVLQSLHYYVNLLLTRKLIGLSLRQSHFERTGQLPTVSELTTQMQSLVHDRGLKLAEKGLTDHSKPNFETDETLLVTSVIYGLTNGCKTIILTRDRDILEQFRKLIYLIDTHYRSLLISDSYQATPENLIATSLTAENDLDYFQNGKRVCLNLPPRFVDWVLPRNPKVVALNCLRIAGHNEHMKLAELQFNAPIDFSRIISLKGRLGGRNADLPDEHNCHLAISPPLIPELGGAAVVVKDNIIEFGNFKGPHVDVAYSLLEVQRYRKAVVDTETPSVIGGTAGMKLADFYLSSRMHFSSGPSWESLDWRELAFAIAYFDASAYFLMDRSVLGFLNDKVRTTIIDRGFSWTKLIREETCSGDLLGRLSRPEQQKIPKMIELEESTRSFDDFGIAYYRSLLGIRRQIGSIISRRVQTEKKRPCRAAEVETIAEYYGGARAKRFVCSENESHADRLWFEGDNLLVKGIVSGVLDGTDVVFLTRDPLFLDQFVKLCHLISGDYVASQFGTRFPDITRQYGEALSVSDSDEVSQTLGPTTLLTLSNSWQNDLLPADPYLLNFHCWLLGRDLGQSVRFAAWTYCAERGIHNLLRTKGENSGQNVQHDRFNLRSSFDPRDGGSARILVSRDRLIRYGANDYPKDSRHGTVASSVSALDLSRVHTNDEPFVFPTVEH